jgi:hypothetical protein
MEVYEAVRTVLAVRSYQEKAMAPDVIRRIVEAGRLAGSAMNSQPWVAQAPLAIAVAIESTKFSFSDASRKRVGILR